MATLNELLRSRSVTIDKNGLSATEVFHIDEPDPYTAIQDFPLPGTGKIFTSGVLVFLSYVKSTKIDPLRNNHTHCLGTVTYGPPESNNNNDKKNANGEIWEWSLNAQTSRITSVNGVTAAESGDLDSKWNGDPVGTAKQITFDATKLTKADAQLPANRKIFDINLTGSNPVVAEGVDVYRPRGALTVTKFYPKATVNIAFRQNLYSLQAKVNKESFPSAAPEWLPREMLFLGANLTVNEVEDEVTIKYNFIFGRPQTGLTWDVYKKQPEAGDPFETVPQVAPGPPPPLPADPIDIDPFQVVWAQFKPTKLPVSTGSPSDVIDVNGILQVGIADVYDEGDFNSLLLVGP